MVDYIFHDDNLFDTCPLPCDNYLLYHIGEKYCKKDSLLATHVQYCFEITFVADGLGGSGTTEATKISKNDCYISLPNELHTLYTDTADPLRFHFLAFNPQPNTKGEKYVSIIEKHIKDTGSRILNIPGLHELIDLTISEVKQISAYSLDVIDVLITRILIEIIRCYSSISIKSYENEIKSESLLVFQIIDYLDKHSADLKNLYELENIFNYSYSYLSSLFHKIMAFPLKSYFRKIKMEEAQKLLSENKYSITEISELLNYSSIYAFSKSYKLYYGYSPKQGIKSKES